MRGRRRLPAAGKGPEPAVGGSPGGRGWALGTRLVPLVAAALVLGGCYETLERAIHGVKPGVTLAGRPLGGHLAPEVRRVVLDLAREGRREPRFAAVDCETAAIIPEEPGRELDVAATVAEVMAAPRGAAVEPRWLTVAPRITRRDLARLTAVLGQYATAIGGSEARYHNIGRAAGIIDRTLLYPGQEFSFWAVLGPMTLERGFRLAPVIVGEALPEPPLSEHDRLPAAHPGGRRQPPDLVWHPRPARGGPALARENLSHCIRRALGPGPARDGPGPGPYNGRRSPGPRPRAASRRPTPDREGWWPWRGGSGSGTGDGRRRLPWRGRPAGSSTWNASNPAVCG